MDELVKKVAVAAAVWSVVFLTIVTLFGDK